VSVLLCVVVWVQGVTLSHDVVYIVCRSSAAIRTFSATTQRRLTDINVKDMRRPQDIAACESQLYVTDNWECIWRVSSQGKDIKRCWTKSPSDRFQPEGLSATSSHILVTSRVTDELMQLDAAGEERRRLPLPDYMKPWHAVESPTGTFVVGHYKTQLKQCQVSEVNTEGEVLRQFSGSLSYTSHIAIDSHGNILVADERNRRILLLDAHLALRRVIIDERQLNYKPPWRLCYNEQSGQLLVGFAYSGGIVVVFNVLQQ